MMTYINRHPEKSSCHPNRFPAGKTKKTKENSKKPLGVMGDLWVSAISKGPPSSNTYWATESPTRHNRVKWVAFTADSWLFQLAVFFKKLAHWLKISSRVWSCPLGSGRDGGVWWGDCRVSSRSIISARDFSRYIDGERILLKKVWTKQILPPATMLFFGRMRLLHPIICLFLGGFLTFRSTIVPYF